jgi:hypothetical protein
MKFKNMLLSLMLSMSTLSSALVWTDGDGYGTGVGVEMVYTQFDQNRVVFKASTGKFYSYNWSNTRSPSAQITPNAQAVVSLLMVAMTTGKKVSIYYDETDSSYPAFTLIILKN